MIAEASNDLPTVNIIVVYFKKTVHNLFTTNIQGSVL